MPEDEELEVTSEPEEVEPEIQYVKEVDGVEVPCDQFGNLIETEYEEEPEAPVEEAEKPKVEYTSPYAATTSTDETVTLSKAELTALIRQEISNDRVATAQQQRAAQELGVSTEMMQELSQYLPQAARMVPPDARGTKAAAGMEIIGAIGLEAEANGWDIGKVLAKYAKGPSAEPAKVTKVLTASERTTTPRAGGNTKPVVRQSFNSAAEAALGGADVLKLIQAERKIHRG